MRICAHSPVTLRRQLGELRNQGSMLIEELIRAVALHPLLENLDMLRLRRQLIERNLMRAERSLDLDSVDDLGPGPPFGRNEHYHRPLRPLVKSVLTGVLLDRLNPVDDVFERLGHRAMH